MLSVRAAGVGRFAAVLACNRRIHTCEESPMSQAYNGMPAHQLTTVTWQKSRLSNPSGNCVEVARLPHGGVAVRNSRDPRGPALVYTNDEMIAFLRSAKAGEFDNIVP